MQAFARRTSQVTRASSSSSSRLLSSRSRASSRPGTRDPRQAGKHNSPSLSCGCAPSPIACNQPTIHCSRSFSAGVLPGWQGECGCHARGRKEWQTGQGTGAAQHLLCGAATHRACSRTRQVRGGAAVWAPGNRDTHHTVPQGGVLFYRATALNFCRTRSSCCAPNPSQNT
jgi:hypothetical protein